MASEVHKQLCSRPRKKWKFYVKACPNQITAIVVGIAVIIKVFASAKKLRNAVRIQLLPSSVQACLNQITVTVVGIAVIIKVFASAKKLRSAVKKRATDDD